MEADDYFKRAVLKSGIPSAQLYIEAAKKYLEKNEKRLAGLCYSLAADVFIDSKQKQPAITNYIKAVEQYLKLDNSQAILILDKLIIHLTGQYKLLAKYCVLLGKVNYQQQRFLEATASFEKAAKAYFALGSVNDAIDCLLKISTIMIKNEDYQRALLYLEAINDRYRKKEIFFELGILRLCINGTQDCTNLLIKNEEYMLYQCYFFLNNLVMAIEMKNRNKFVKLIKDYHHTHRLKKWMLNLLNNIF